MFRYLAPSLAASVVTLAGAAVAAAFRRPRRAFLGLAMGFSAGLLAWVSVFELWPRAAESLGLPLAVGGYIIGFLLFRALEALAPHRHGPRAVNGHEGHEQENHGHEGHEHAIEAARDSAGAPVLGRAAFVIAAGVALHNVLEGLAMGASFAIQTELGDAIALGAAIHNLPIGMAVAIPFISGGMSAASTLGIATMVAATMPLGTYLGFLAAGLPQLVFHLILAIGGGAILGMVATEVLPEARGYHARAALAGAVLGLLLATVMG